MTTNKVKPDIDPKQLASLLEKASMLPKDKLAKAKEYIGDLGQEAQLMKIRKNGLMHL